MASYRDLKVYQLASSIDEEIFRLTEKFPKNETYGLIDQLRRSSHSMVANIAEGFGRRFYIQEYIRFLVFAQASCDETREHVTASFKRGYCTKDEFILFDDQLDHLGRMFTLLIRKLRPTSKRVVE